MPHTIHPPPSPLCISLLFFVLLLSLSADSYLVNSFSVPNCPTNYCGGHKISYPFWVAPASSNLPSYCIHPGMMVTCRDQTTPILGSPPNTYIMAVINYMNQTVSIVDANVNNADVPCPLPSHNFTFKPDSPLSLTPADANLTFFLDCGSPAGSHPDEHEIACHPSAGDRRFYVFASEEIPRDFNQDWECRKTVVAPVLSVELKTSGPLGAEFDRILKQGFEVGWPPAFSSDCEKCKRSNGSCGFLPTGDLTCFCSDGSARQNCGSVTHAKEKILKGKDSQKKKLIIGLPSAAGGFILACTLCFFLYRLKKRGQHLPFIRTTSSESISKDPELGSTIYQTHLFSYDELEEATNCFDSSRELGDGGFGTVYKGKLRDGRMVAVKRLYEHNYKRVEQFMNEVAILSRLCHQNLVNLYGCTSRHSRELLLVYEFVPNGTVADHLHGSRANEAALTWPIRLSIAIETADALSYLHAVEPPIVHRDVKTTNILLDRSFHVKVADFGLSRLFPTDATHVSTAPQGTPGYLDPEYHKCYQLTDKSDVYSFGVVLVELISSKPAVDITRDRSEINLANMAMNKIQSSELDQLVDPRLGYQSDGKTKKMIKMVAELAFRCLQSDGDVRPPIKEVLEVLRGIESGGYGEEEVEGDVPMQDKAGVPNSVPPFSPDSVTDRWVSKSTTPNTSE